MSKYITIPLSKRGKYAGQHEAIIDECDKDLAEFNWHVKIEPNVKYAKRWNDSHKLVSLHREILERILDRKLKRSEHVDHIDGDGLNNRRENLRIANKSQNNWNTGKRSDNTSGYKGVSWNAERQKWVAQISANNKHEFLGRFDTPEEAYAAYCEAAKALHGKFANYD